MEIPELTSEMKEPFTETTEPAMKVEVLILTKPKHTKRVAAEIKSAAASKARRLAANKVENQPITHVSSITRKTDDAPANDADDSPRLIMYSIQ